MPELGADCGTAAPDNGYDLRQITIGSEGGLARWTLQAFESFTAAALQASADTWRAAEMG